MKRIAALVLTLALFTPQTVFAQEIATSSGSIATESGTVASTPSASLVPFTESTPSAEASPTPQLTITQTPTPPASANIRLPIHIRQPENEDFRGRENAQFTVDNLTAGSHVAIIDPSGAAVSDARIHEQTVGSVTTYAVSPGLSFRPGKYTLRITDDLGNTQTQDFYWGVLAINPDKSIYAPGETSFLSMAVLDQTGRVVCNADVTLTVTDPSGKPTVLETKDGSITVNPVCHDSSVTTIPDYAATYKTGGEGQYGLTLSATTANGTFTITDGFDVRTDVPFDVRRNGPTRIYPPNFYPMRLTMTANADFSGDVTETVPQNFTVQPLSGVAPYAGVSIIAPTVDTSTYFVHLTYPFSGSYPVTLGFGDPLNEPALAAQYAQFGLVGHDGVDFALPEGTPVLAADSGTVIFAGDGVYGQTVVLEHSWGRSYYGHLSSIGVHVGDLVTQGQEIAKSGHTGFVTAPHLHFGIKLKNADMQNGFYGKTDPMPYLTGSSAAGDTTVKKIVWHVSMKKGETETIGYSFQAPRVSPQFYLLGPLTFTHNVQASSGISNNPFVLGDATPSASLSQTAPQSDTVIPVFSESRQWQIASDAVGTLYPAADVSLGLWTDNSGGTTNIYSAISEGTASYNDSNYIIGGLSATNDDYVFTNTASPSDVQTVTAFTVNFRGSRSKNKATTIDVLYCVGASCTPTTQVGTTQSMTSSFALYSVTASGLSLTKSDIDSLKLVFRGSATGGAQAEVSAAQVDITYTPVPSGPTNDQLLRHGEWFNSSGARQSFTF